MLYTVANQRTVRVHRERAASDFQTRIGKPPQGI